MRRVVELSEEGEVVAGSGGAFPEPFRLPMPEDKAFTYVSCNNGSRRVDDILRAAALDMGAPEDAPPSYSSAWPDLYSHSLHEAVAAEAAEASNGGAPPAVPLASMSFTLVGGNAGMPRIPQWGANRTPDKDNSNNSNSNAASPSNDSSGDGEDNGDGLDDDRAARDAAAWLLYTLLPGAVCPDELVAQGQFNTLLGTATGRWLPLNFSRPIPQGPVVAATPGGYVLGEIQNTYTSCLSVLLTTRAAAADGQEGAGLSHAAGGGGGKGGGRLDLADLLPQYLPDGGRLDSVVSAGCFSLTPCALHHNLP